MLEIGKFFLGAPYVAGTLETKGAEHLVANLREHDCVTFVENVVALAWLIKLQGKSFEAFLEVTPEDTLQKRTVAGLLLAATLFFRLDS